MSVTQEHWFHAPNPLTRELPDWKSIAEIAAALRNDPLADLNISALSIMQRHELLIGDKMPLHPTARSLKAAMTMVSMHRLSLRVRNTALAEGRRMVERAVEAATSGHDFLKAPPAPGAALLVLKGMSGTAKSVTAKLTLTRLIGPQVIRHVDEPQSLLVSATQLNWLFVAMSHDGSRGGLLNGILLALDRALGTTHALDLPKRFKSVEKLVGAVIALLHTYYAGILVIDEIQLLNLAESPHAELMQLFLLNLANSGIPLVLIGNPFGFTWLSKLSQNLTRLVERPQFFFHPCGALDSEDDEWPSVSEGVVRYYLLDEPAQDLEACKAVLRRRSGGIARLALSLWSNAQVDALFDGRNSLCAQDIEAAYADESFAPARPLVDGFAQRNPALLLQWRDVDIPVDLYASYWGKPLLEPAVERRHVTRPNANPALSKAAASAHTPASSPSSGALTPTAAARLKGASTRARNRQQRREDLVKTLDEEDMRIDGLKKHALDSLDELMREIQNQKGGSGPTLTPLEPPKAS